MHKILVATVSTLLVAGLVAAATVAESPPWSAGSPGDAAAARTPAGAAVPTGLPAAGAAGAVGASGQLPPAAGLSRLASGAAPLAVRREFPRVDDRLRTQLLAAAPTDQVTVFVHAQSVAAAKSAVRDQGLRLLTTFDKVGVAAAAGSPAAVRTLEGVRGLSYLEADAPVRHLMDSSHDATRTKEARAGFSVTYDEPQPDKPGKVERRCTVRRDRRGRVVRDRRGRPRQTCRTVRTPPQPQPPIKRTLTSPGVDGSGVTIAVIDTGVDATHPMFQQDGRSKVVRNLKFVGGATCIVADCEGQPGRANNQMFVPVSDSDTMSTGGHGTHVAGIAAGVDVTTSDGVKLHGAAPGAKLVMLGMGVTPLHLLATNAGINWVLEHHANPCGDRSCPPVKVVNNSYGDPGEFEPESLTTKLQRALVQAGVVMVWANGNGDLVTGGGDGSDNRSNPPAQDPTPGILSVANYDDGNAGDRDATLAFSSSRGEKGRPLTYPDVSAPGTDILSACRPQLAVCRDAGVHDPNYGIIGGTSMAAPHVAGIVAQMFSANPALTPAEVEDALEDTARPFAFGGSYEADPTNDGITSFDKGHGLVDAVGAVARARIFPVFPAAVSPCHADGPVVVDPAGDARDVFVVERTPLPSEPALDVVEASMGWDSAARVASFRIRVTDLGPTPLTAGSNGENFRVFLTHHGTELTLNASRNAAGTQSFSVTNGATLTGSFDPGANVITINVPADALKSETAPALADGTVLLGFSVLGRRSLGAAAPPADTAFGRCPYTLGLGAVPPPAGVTTGPDPKPAQRAPAPTGPSAATLHPGGPPDTWRGGPFTGVAVPDLGTECDGVREGDPCENRFITLEVPPEGATLTVKITPDVAVNDFDLRVYDPNNALVKTSAGAPILDSTTSTETVSARVTLPGLYRIEVNPFTTVEATYRGEAQLN